MSNTAFVVISALLGGAVFYWFRQVTDQHPGVLTFFVGSSMTLLTIVLIRNFIVKRYKDRQNLRKISLFKYGSFIFWVIATIIALIIAYTREGSWEMGLLFLVEIFFILIILYLLLFKILNWFK